MQDTQNFQSLRKTLGVVTSITEMSDSTVQSTLSIAGTLTNSVYSNRTIYFLLYFKNILIDFKERGSRD